MNDKELGYQFTSSLFHVELGEDDDTNPFRYGKQLAEWIRNQFIQLGYDVEEVIAEDWGFCVMLKRKPYNLWIGCGNMVDMSHYEISEEEKKTFIPDIDKLVWTCFPTVEILILKLFSKKIKLASKKELLKVNDELKNILESTSGIFLLVEKI